MKHRLQRHQRPWERTERLRAGLVGLAALATAGAVVGGVPLATRSGSSVTAAALTPELPVTTDETTPVERVTRAEERAQVEAARVAAAAALPAAVSLATDLVLQPNGWYCGPAATHIALSAAGAVLSMDDIAGRLGTTTRGTDSAYDVTRVMSALLPAAGYLTREIPSYPAQAAEAELLRVDVMTSVAKGDAVVANIAGSQTDSAGQFHSYPGGHYIAVVGYADNGVNVLIADPADADGNQMYWLPVTGLADWISTRGYTTG